MSSHLADQYLKMPESLLHQRIEEKRADLGKDLIILGHFYQRPEVIQHSDFQGDSLDLSKKASEEKAKYIVFCGVHFMAESATILSRGDQVVYLPNLNAGCPMADMADTADIEKAWKKITEISTHIVPITYMNSTAHLKAFCGKNDGAVCTSSNAASIFKYYFEKFEKIFFFPDEHLGRNTGYELGLIAKDMLVWDPAQELGGNSPKAIQEAKLILWKGYCHVHTFFTPAHIRTMKEKYPDALVVVHPECTRDVVQIADASGSTGFIKRFVEDAPQDAEIIIGTEIHHAINLGMWNKDKKVIGLARSLCPNMYKINLYNLLWTLDNLQSQTNRIRVSEHIKKDAKKALHRMLNFYDQKRHLGTHSKSKVCGVSL